MPPSASASYTTSALVSPVWGRASAWFSIITARLARGGGSISACAAGLVVGATVGTIAGGIADATVGTAVGAIGVAGNGVGGTRVGSSGGLVGWGAGGGGAF